MTATANEPRKGAATTLPQENLTERKHAVTFVGSVAKNPIADRKIYILGINIQYGGIGKDSNEPASTRQGVTKRAGRPEMINSHGTLRIIYVDIILVSEISIWRRENASGRLHGKGN
jgi:hypothetical protein